MKLIHLAVKNNKRKHANNTPCEESYWHVCVGRLLKLSRSISVELYTNGLYQCQTIDVT